MRGRNREIQRERAGEKGETEGRNARTIKRQSRVGIEGLESTGKNADGSVTTATATSSTDSNIAVIIQ